MFIYPHACSNASSGTFISRKTFRLNHQPPAVTGNAANAVTANNVPTVARSAARSPPPRARAASTVPPMVMPMPMLVMIKQSIEALLTAASPELPT